MRIGELARLCGVSASKIRFFERAGVLPAPRRGANGYREYPPESVDSIALILQSQRLGFSIDEIRQAAPAGGLNTLNCDQILTLLRRKRTTVRAQLLELTELKDAIETSIRDFEKRRRRRPAPPQ